jgi:hypothetical protein
MELPADTDSRDVDVITQGVKAARDGLPVRHCPHKPGSREAHYWLAGWALTEPAKALTAVRKTT